MAWVACGLRIPRLRSEANDPRPFSPLAGKVGDLGRSRFPAGKRGIGNTCVRPV